MRSAAEPSTGLLDVTRTSLAELRRNPTPRQTAQAGRMINELLVAPPAVQEQNDGMFTSAAERG
jgi:hypothetical protein